MKKITLPLLLALAASAGFAQQGADIVGRIVGGQKAAIAIPDFRGAGKAANFVNTFNQTLFRDIEDAGVFKMAPKSMYPLAIPQRPEDFRKPLKYDANNRTRAPWLQDWSEPPVSSDFLAFGYTAEQDNQIVLFGWLFNVKQPEVSSAQVLGKIYHGTLDEDGARKVAHEFATDILKQFGVESLAGSKIYFVSNRSGSKEIWMMDYDGSNQKQFTFYKNLITMPNVSPDGTRLAFTSFTGGAGPSIVIHSLETGRKIPFYNQRASMNATASFTPNGKQIIYSSSASGWAQLYMANADGSNLQRLTNTRSIEVEPKINPKTGNEILFVSGRGGAQQVYKMNIDGADVTRLTTGEGEASNPAWNPQGSHMAFAWTRGYSPGNWNIFIMDVATRDYVQLTQGAGRNENPSWAPDGRHIVISSNRGGSTQIWSMLADGTQLRQLTSAGVNEKPVWTK